MKNEMRDCPILVNSWFLFISDTIHYWFTFMFGFLSILIAYTVGSVFMLASSFTLSRYIVFLVSTIFLYPCLIFNTHQMVKMIEELRKIQRKMILGVIDSNQICEKLVKLNEKYEKQPLSLISVF